MGASIAGVCTLDVQAVPMELQCREASQLHEVALRWPTWHVHRRTAVVHVVDVQARELVAAVVVRLAVDPHGG